MERQLSELISKYSKLITEDKLNAILVDFVNAYGRPEKACLHEHWLKDQDLQRVFQEQIKSNASFESVCKGLGFWSEEIEKKFNAFNTKTQDIFITALTKESLLAEKVRPKAIIEESFEINFIKMDSALAADFAETFDDTCAQKIETQLLDLEKMSGDAQQKIQFEELMRSLYRDLHSIKGTARFISASLTEKIIHASEDLLGFAQQFHSQLSKDDLKNIFNHILKSIDIALGLRKLIVEQQSEESFWQDPTSKNNYLSYLLKLEALKKELDQRGLQVKIADVASEF